MSGRKNSVCKGFCICFLVLFIVSIFTGNPFHIMIIFLLLLIPVLICNAAVSKKEKGENFAPTTALPPQTSSSRPQLHQKIRENKPLVQELRVKQEFCPECGSPIAGDYCEFCGAKIQE